MKRLFLFSGLPGVGKTTISKALSDRIGSTIVDLDDFKKTDVDPILVKSQIDPPEIRWAYYQKALNHVVSLFKSGINSAILDEVFHLNCLRESVEDFCLKQDIEVLWIEVRCSYQIIERRLRSSGRANHILSTDEALKMNSLFQKIFERFPVHKTNHIILTNDSETDGETHMERILTRC